MNKCVPPVLAVFLILFSVAGLANASQTYTVPSLGKQTVSIPLSKGDFVTGTLSVTGGSGNDIDFRVEGPSGNVLTSYDRATQLTFSFAASTTGTYTMTLDNSFSELSDKSVTVDYTVQHLGATGDGSNDMFLIAAVVVAVVALLIVLAVVYSKRRPRKRKA